MNKISFKILAASVALLLSPALFAQEQEMPSADDMAVDGEFVWVDPDIVPSADQEYYLVQFVPADSANYETVTVKAFMEVEVVKGGCASVMSGNGIIIFALIAGAGMVFSLKRRKNYFEGK